MIGRVLCRVGLHRWDPQRLRGLDGTLWRLCTRCGTTLREPWQ